MFSSYHSFETSIEFNFLCFSSSLFLFVFAFFRDSKTEKFELTDKFQSQFSKELIKNLTTHKNCDYVIDIENNEVFYNSLYKSSNTKLITLRDYFDDVLTKN